MRAIALLSGGLDSVVATWAARKRHEMRLAITCDYGQRAAAREIQAAQAVARQVPCKHVVVSLPWLGALGGNALTDAKAALPEITPDRLDHAASTHASASAVWVPNRNGVLLNVAAAYADALGCDAIVCGFNREEAATFPDNTGEFADAATAFFGYSTWSHPHVISPTVALSKTEIVKLAVEIDAPLELVWSCYRGDYEHCWECESCLRLKRALEGAGVWEAWLEKR